MVEVRVSVVVQVLEGHPTLVQGLVRVVLVAMVREALVHHREQVYVLVIQLVVLHETGSVMV